VRAALGPDGWGSADELRKDDGNTDYSREYWEAEAENKVHILSAVNETLAEMARLDWEGQLERRTWYKDSKAYKRLYKAINDVYPLIAGKTKPEAAV
jgi:hypothetical protein